MSEKNIEMMKKFLEAKKNKNVNANKDTNITGKPFNTEQRARKAARSNRKPGGMFDK
jgi:hypothetical protein